MQSTYNLTRLKSPSSYLGNLNNTRLPSSNTAPSTPSVCRDRAVISSALEQFDVDEFMQSLEDLHRRSPVSAKEYKHSLFSRTDSSRRTVSSYSDHSNGKRSNSLDSGGHRDAVVVNSIHHVHNNESSGVPRVD
uniref:Uncharacterized protein n=1 Tax=Anopheles maculatus TaxID=74869 RepID=A0A182SLQ1_9DIPT